MTYNKAPIHEAVFDIKVDRVQNNDIDSYKSLLKDKLSEFDTVESKVVVSGMLRINPSSDEFHQKQDKKVIGVVYSNSQLNYKLQFRKDGFTLNMLAPYTNWEDFSSLAFEYWEIYKESINPVGIKRIALRYINKINLPVEKLDFKDYLLNMPNMPESLDNGYTSMLQRVETICKTSGNNAIITKNFKSIDNMELLPFILDLDVYKTKNISTNDIEGEFEVIRRDKNMIFESLITNKTRELFN